MKISLICEKLNILAEYNSSGQRQLENSLLVVPFIVLFSHVVLELYLDYFVTPYLIFARDTLSYFFLLGLHAAICLSPSTINFTVVEWSILVFFVGRLAVELDQCCKSAPKGLPASTHHQETKPAHQRYISVALHMLHTYLRCVQ